MVPLSKENERQMYFRLAERNSLRNLNGTRFSKRQERTLLVSQLSRWRIFSGASGNVSIFSASLLQAKILSESSTTMTPGRAGAICIGSLLGDCKSQSPPTNWCSAPVAYEQGISFTGDGNQKFCDCSI